MDSRFNVGNAVIETLQLSFDSRKRVINCIDNLFFVSYVTIISFLYLLFRRNSKKVAQSIEI
ncbi:hypothetical protein SAMN05216218_1053 [Halorientalis regularis]|uniref:Uncharacterized protein n=1 Tax=Halorientalis regularis TaxID=660518 RepID=A0A1G7JNF8_9EURY|nr:hypothetical protein SAMN05216218_1053 [Halorientalis regularis]